MPDQRRQRAIRYAFNIGSNAWLEMQWYLFAAMVLLGAAYMLSVNEHVRVDIIYGRVAAAHARRGSTCSA